MAGFGANITSATSSSLPSIFEVLAQESLKTSVQPALEHAIRIIAQKNPDRFGWLYRRSDEVYLLLNLILENYYLKYYDGSFAENFYGMRRVDASKSDDESRDRLSDTIRNKSVVFLVLLPYLKSKCEKYYELEKEKQQNSAISGGSKSLIQKLTSVFLSCYPLLHFLSEGSYLVYQFLYMMKKSEYHSPYTRLAGCKLCNLTEFDMIQHKTFQVKLDLSDKSLLRKMAAVLAYSAHYVAVGVSSGLSVGVFFLQFLEWWYTSDTQAVSLTALPTPLPPQKQDYESLPKMNNICPICNKIRTNNTVLSITGYVFCYPCIYRHLQQHRSCPVTGYPATTEHLVRLYLPDG